MKEEIEALATRIDELQEAKEAGRQARLEARERGTFQEERAELNAGVIARTKELTELRERMAFIFAAQHGWKQSQSPFSVSCLASGASCSRDGLKTWNVEGLKVLDHPNWFRKDRRAAAAVGHLFEIPDYAKTWAFEHWLQMTVSDFPSWYWPKECKLVVYTPFLVRSLP